MRDAEDDEKRVRITHGNLIVVGVSMSDFLTGPWEPAPDSVSIVGSQIEWSMNDPAVKRYLKPLYGVPGLSEMAFDAKNPQRGVPE